MKAIKWTKKKLVIFVIVISLIIVIIQSLIVQKTKFEKLDTYLGIGDSLALGTTPSGDSNKSYVDYLGESLKETGIIKEYHKAFTRHNMKSAELLKIVEKDAIGINGDQSVKFSDLAKKASIVTISVGLADILSEFKYLPMDRVLSFDQEVILNKLVIVQHNLYEIVEEIKNYNHDVKIYLVGYYFLFPWISSENRQAFSGIFNEIKEIYKEVAQDTSTTFIDISKVGDQEFVSSILSIYPNQDGYKLISNLIKKEIDKSTV